MSAANFCMLKSDAHPLYPYFFLHILISGFIFPPSATKRSSHATEDANSA